MTIYDTTIIAPPPKKKNNTWEHLCSDESRGGGPGACPPPQKCLRCIKLELFSQIYKKMSYDVEFSKFLLNIL